VSLRSFCEVLYYCDGRMKAPLDITLRGRRVTARNWQSYLKDKKEYSAPKPHDAQEPAQICFGYSRPAREVRRIGGARRLPPWPRCLTRGWTPQVIDAFQQRSGTKKDTRIQVPPIRPWPLLVGPLPQCSPHRCP
jgi:hypothetical protein